MKLEDQVVSLELAKRLKELGVKQESLFHWTETHIPHIEWTVRFNPQGLFQTLSAFTVAELGDMIPCAYQVIKHDDCWVGYKVEAWSQRGRGPFLDVLQNSNVLAETEANARARMLIYLIENNLITPTH